MRTKTIFGSLLCITLVLVVFILALQGCATVPPIPIKMSAIASPEQQIGDNETITSQKKHFVSVAPVPLKKQGIGAVGPNISFILFVKNCSEKPIDISNDNVTVIFKGKTDGTTRILSIRSFDYLINEAARKDMRETVARSRAKEFATLVENYSYNMLDSGGGVPNRREKVIEELVMKPQTIMPEESADGLVIFDTKRLDYRVEGDFQVLVSVDGEEHEFTFKRSLSE